MLAFFPMPLIDVALPLPLFRAFSYRLPDGLAGSVEPGSRVLVPFRNKREIGIVIGPAEPREGVKYKEVIAAPDDAPSVDPPMLALCQWIAEYLNCLISGSTGIGKTWLACALAHQAAREGHSVLYARVPRLLTELDLGRADGRYPKS